jgi:hypothetical protein
MSFVQAAFEAVDAGGYVGQIRLMTMSAERALLALR